MMIKRFFALFGLLLMVSCGRGKVDIASPADGQTFNLDTFTSLDVQIANNEFDGITIEFRGQESVSDIRCDNTTNSPIARCYRNFAQGGFTGGNFGSCTQQVPCTVFVIARDSGGNVAFRSIRFVRGGTGTGGGAPAPGR